MAVTHGIPASPLIERNTPKSDFVPANFAEMYQHYYVYVLRLLVKQGIDQQDADDVAQVLFIKMSEKGLLEQFDPEREFNGRPAVFRTLLSGFVLKYAMGFRKRQRITQDREPTLVDTIVKQDHTPGDTNDMTWGETYGPYFEDEYSDVSDSQFRTAIRSHLATARTGRKDSQLDLVALFDEIDRQVTDEGRYSTTDLMAKFSVTRTTIHNWLEKLRVEVAKAVELHG